MSTITQGEPQFSIIEKTQKSTAEALAFGQGTKLNASYFEVHVTFPVLVEVAVQEMSDEELLVAAEKAGTFNLLDAPEEDGYNDLLKRE